MWEMVVMENQQPRRVGQRKCHAADDAIHREEIQKKMYLQ